MTAGIISAKNRTIGIGPYDDFLQTDASINFGNSGGPLFNLKGEVVGINTAINAQGQGLGFAIPIDEAKIHLDELKKYGHVVRAWLGLLGENITPAVENYYRLPVNHGVVILGVVRHGPAQKVGLAGGDILIRINGQELHDRADVQRILSKLKPGQNIEVVFNRARKQIKGVLKLGTAPLNKSADSDESEPSDELL